jgi:hypothetical protein
MNRKQRLQTVFDGGIPDKVPHFEMLFQLPEEAFDLSWPTPDEFLKASAAEKEQLVEKHLDIWEKIIERYDYSAISVSLGQGDADMLSRAKARFGDDVMVYDFNGQGTYWMPSGGEMVEFFEMLYERPDDAHEGEEGTEHDAGNDLGDAHCGDTQLASETSSNVASRLETLHDRKQPNDLAERLTIDDSIHRREHLLTAKRFLYVVHTESNNDRDDRREVECCCLVGKIVESVHAPCKANNDETAQKDHPHDG